MARYTFRRYDLKVIGRDPGADQVTVDPIQAYICVHAPEEGTDFVDYDPAQTIRVSNFPFARVTRLSGALSQTLGKLQAEGKTACPSPEMHLHQADWYIRTKYLVR